MKREDLKLGMTFHMTGETPGDHSCWQISKIEKKNKLIELSYSVNFVEVSDMAGKPLVSYKTDEDINHMLSLIDRGRWVMV